MSGIDKQVAFRSSEEHVREILAEKFAEIWPDVLLFFIIRTQKLNATLGNPIDAIIIQVICWHHFLLNIREIVDTMTVVSTQL